MDKKKQRSLRIEKRKVNRTPETEEQKKEKLRIKREKDGARRRTKNLIEEKKRSSEAEDREKQCPWPLSKD